MDGLDLATRGRVDALLADPGLKKSLERAVNRGLSNVEIAEALAAYGFPNTKENPHDASAINRFKRALEFLQEGES